jgi:hypothetical protein
MGICCDVGGRTRAAQWAAYLPLRVAAGACLQAAWWFSGCTARQRPLAMWFLACWLSMVLRAPAPPSLRLCLYSSSTRRYDTILGNRHILANAFSSCVTAAPCFDGNAPRALPFAAQTGRTRRTCRHSTLGVRFVRWFSALLRARAWPSAVVPSGAAARGILHYHATGQLSAWHCAIHHLPPPATWFIHPAAL